MPENDFEKLRPHPFRCRPDEKRSSAEPGPASDPIPGYAELCVTTNYTFLTGASHPEEFIVQGAAMGCRAVGVTDLHTVAGVVRAHVAARDAGFRFVLGSRIAPTDLPGCSICLYPTDMDSYRRMCRLLTIGKRRAPKGECHLTSADLAPHHAGLLAIVLLDDPRADTAADQLRRLCAFFDDDRLSLAITALYGPDDRDRADASVRLSRSLGVPLVATNDAHYHHPDRRMLHDVVTCIRHGCTLAQAGFKLHANAEKYLKLPEEMHRLFAEHPAALARTIEITDRTAGFNLDQLRYEYPDEIVPKGITPQQHLTNLTWEGARRIYGPEVPEKVVKLLGHELALIEQLNYAPYFLTVFDLVRYARSGREDPDQPPPADWPGPILCQGRGAAANSAVCFCLGVTAVDPTKISLLFERFISVERNEPPDIDIDFEHERREEVIQYIYRKYGRERAALTAEVITYRRRSAVRDVGKALGLSLDLVDRLAKDIEWFDKGSVDPRRWREMGLNPEDPTLRWLARLVEDILGFPRHLSQHVGGFVITRSPLCELVPVENAAMPDRTVIEWDKDDIDAAGMLKVDVLGLGMLTAISKCLALVNAGRGTEGQRDRGTEWGRGERDQEVVERGRCIEASRGVVVCRQKADEECCHGGCADIPRSEGVAAWDGTRPGGLHPDCEDATRGEIWPDIADAAGRDLGAIEHRRGIREADVGRVSPFPEDRQRFARGTGDPARTGDQHEPDAREPRGHIPAPGTRPHAPIPDPEDRSPHQGEQEEPITSDPAPPAPAAPSLPPTLSLCPSVPLSLLTIPFEDPATYAMIQRADTVGVFQIESRAQMSMLPRLKPKEFYDLVIEVAIVRPGPIQGNMVHPYLRRRSGQEMPEILPDTVPQHVREGVHEVLRKTLGVPLFQEQCMALAVKAAGFSAGKADQLRRAMAAWKRKGDQIYRFGKELIEGMTANGIPREFAERCFEQIKGFSEYGFPESHAASFALLVYASAWLKCHHPAEFCAALLNSQPMGFYAPAQLIRDAREHGVTVLPIDVNRSAWDCTIEREEAHAEPTGPGTVRMGMRLVSGLGRPAADRIAAVVAQRGPFRTMLALWRAADVPARAMRRLAAADAFGSMGLSRQQALWQARLLRDDPLPLFELGESNDSKRATDGDATDGDAEEGGDGLRSLPPISPLRQVVLDYDSTGLSLKAHPLSFAREELAAKGARPCADLRDPAKTPDGELITVAGLVLVRQRPGTANEVTFITLEDETGIANLIVWKRVYHRYRRQASARMVIATGRVQRQGEVVHITVTRMRNGESAIDDLAIDSRNFR